MIRRLLAASLVCSLPAIGAWAAGCGTDLPNNPDYGVVPEAGLFQTGNGNSSGGSGYGSGSGASSGGSGSGGTTAFDAAPPPCPTADRFCAEPFTFPYGGEVSVQVRGTFSATGWTTGGVAMTHDAGSDAWTASVPVPWDTAVDYKFYATEPDGGTQWFDDPNPAVSTMVDDAGVTNSVFPATTCTTFTCQQPGPAPAGVFDWRDAVIYFVFVDRFFDGDPSNNCSVSGSSTEGTPGTSIYASNNYLGGDWQGVTQQINNGYFNDLGVNTLWITVPVKNADTVLGAGEYCDNGNCGPNSLQYSAYAGYWLLDPGDFSGANGNVEPCFGTPTDLHNLVSAAHAKNLKVLFDYAMVDIHTSSPLYAQNPSWFTPFCQCGANGCGNYNDYKCWFTPYLAHFDFTNSAEARNYSVAAALQLVTTYGNDAFRLDAIKQVDPSWLAALRPQVNAYEQSVADGGAVQHFYMVGETYDFEDTGYIASFLNPQTALDGQFDFPERYRLVDVMLARDTGNLLDFCSTAPTSPQNQNCSWNFNTPPGMQGLASFIDTNDAFYEQWAPGSVMSTFIGNQDLPRSIHFAEQTMPSWLSMGATGTQGIQNAVTYNGEFQPNSDTWTQEPAPETDPNTYERLANAFAVTLTTKGAPLIYYGDEIGLPGAGDPDNRRMMMWSGLTTCPGQGPTCQQGLHDRIATLGQIRANHPALRRGTRTEIVNNQPDLWVFSVTTSVNGVADTVYVAINRSDSSITTTGIPAGIPELVVGGAKSTGTDAIPPRETRIFSSYVPQVADAGTDGG
jgi:glycosidase